MDNFNEPMKYINHLSVYNDIMVISSISSSLMSVGLARPPSHQMYQLGIGNKNATIDQC